MSTCFIHFLSFFFFYCHSRLIEWIKNEAHSNLCEPQILFRTWPLDWGYVWKCSCGASAAMQLFRQRINEMEATVIWEQFPLVLLDYLNSSQCLTLSLDKIHLRHTINGLVKSPWSFCHGHFRRTRKHILRHTRGDSRARGKLWREKKDLSSGPFNVI